MPATARQTDSWERHNHLGPPWYSPLLNVRSRPDPLVGYYHPSYIGRQTGVNHCGLLFAFPPTDRSGIDRLFRREIADLMAGDLNARHVDWNSRLNTKRRKLLRYYADENSFLILDTVWIDGLLYKLRLLNFPSYIVHTILPQGLDVRSVLPDGHVISSRNVG